MKIKLTKFRDDLILPVRMHYNDAGIDCYAQDDYWLPEITVGSSGASLSVKSCPTTISLGFGLEIPDGYMATLRPRSSFNAKNIITQIGTIDSGYRGEIKAIFINLNNTPFQIKKGDRICQIVVEPVVLAEFVSDLDNNRGSGGFGSTGK